MENIIYGLQQQNNNEICLNFDLCDLCDSIDYFLKIIFNHKNHINQSSDKKLK